MTTAAEVDASRIGFIGRDMDGIQFDFVLPGILRHGDIEDVVRLIEPTSILILGGDQDKWSTGIESLVQYARSAYRKGVLDFDVFLGGHRFSQSMRERAYALLAKHLES